MRISLVFGSLAIALLATAARADDKAAIEAANAKFMDAVANKTSVKTFYTQTAVTLPDHGEMLKGPDAITAYWDEGSKAMTDFKLNTVDVTRLGPRTLREIGTYSLKMTGSPDESFGKYLVIWRKERGGWKIDSDIWNENK